MKVERHPKFEKNFKKRIANNPAKAKRFAERLKLFMENPSNPILKDHQLTGKKKSFRSFWVAGDIRVIYEPISKNHVIFLDMGSHNQVY